MKLIFFNFRSNVLQVKRIIKMQSMHTGVRNVIGLNMTAFLSGNYHS